MCFMYYYYEMAKIIEDFKSDGSRTRLTILAAALAGKRKRKKHSLVTNDMPDPRRHGGGRATAW